MIHIGGDSIEGVRVLVTLSSDVELQKTGTKTLTGGNMDTYGGDQTYNTWDIVEPTYLKTTSTETEATSGFLGNDSIPRQNIESVTFLDSTADAPSSGTWDVSAAGDGSIIAWYTGSNPYQVYIASSRQIYANADSSYLFSYIGYDSACTATSVINNIDLLDVTGVTNMSYMFRYCGYTAMTSLDLGTKFDTSNVTNMRNMFHYAGYTAMTTLELGDNFDTSNVTNMTSMFNRCGQLSLQTLDLEFKFDTSSATTMSYMFYRCGQSSMYALDLRDLFDTSSVTNMSYMFRYCGYSKLISLDLGDLFDTSNVTNMNYMLDYLGYTSMKTLEMGPGFTQIASTSTDFATNLGNSNTQIICVTSTIRSSSTAFKLSSSSSTTRSISTGATIYADSDGVGARNLLATSGETSSSSGFLGNTTYARQYIESVTFLDTLTDIPGDYVAVWHGSANKGSIAVAITGSSPYQVYIASSRQMYANADSSYLFSYIGYNSACTATSVINGLELLDTTNVTNMSRMFNYCGYQKMTSLDLGANFDTSNVTNMNNMFNSCGDKNMSSLDLGDKFDTSKVTNMSYMFSWCGRYNLTSLDLGDKFYTSSVTTMANMFSHCGSQRMSSLELGDNFDTSSVTDMGGLFWYCGKNMPSLDLGSKFDTSNVTDMYGTFAGIGSSEMNFNLGDKFDTSNVTAMDCLFYNSTFATLDLGDKFDTSSVTGMYCMFSGTKIGGSLNLGDKFDTSNVTDMERMFQYFSATSLSLGNKFDTTNVSTMVYMFHVASCDYIDLGPAFTKIADGVGMDDDGNDCVGYYNAFNSGTDIIYAPESIFINRNTFRLNKTSTTTISYTGGTIIPKYKPEWINTSTTLEINETNSEDSKIKIVIEGTTKASGNTRVTKYGDVNCDGVVNSSDSELINSYVSGSATLTVTGLANADVNLDGVVDANDATDIDTYSILPYVAGATLYGDANADGVVNSLDIDEIDMDMQGDDFAASQANADVNLDGIIHAEDKIIIQKYLNGDLNTLPVPTNVVGYNSVLQSKLTANDISVMIDGEIASGINKKVEIINYRRFTIWRCEL